MLAEGKKAFDFTLNNQDGEKIKLSDFYSKKDPINRKWIVLYFYPKDNTPGCTIEAVDFSSFVKDFERLHAVILGVSPDSEKSHKNFCTKQNLKITLLSDPDKKALKKYSAWGIKKMYGKEFEGVKRTTYLINPNGKIEKIWNNVRAKGHAKKVLQTLREIHNSMLPG